MKPRQLYKNSTAKTDMDEEIDTLNNSISYLYSNVRDPEMIFKFVPEC